MRCNTPLRGCRFSTRSTPALCATRRLDAIRPDAPVRLSDAAAPQDQQLLDDEIGRRYRRLIVGRAELGHSYRQLALVEGLSSVEAARKAVGRASKSWSTSCQMRRDDSGDVVDDAVDAITLNQDVHWERCAQLATPAQRRALSTLQALGPFFKAGDSTGPSPTASGAPASPFAGHFTRRAVHVLMVLATVGVAAAALLLPWRWDEYYRAHGHVAVFLTILLVGHGASAALLLFAGRRDRRTSLLGGYFLFKATVAVPHMLPAFWGQMPPVGVLEGSFWEISTQTRLFLFLYAFPQAYAVAPAFLWAF